MATTKLPITFCLNFPTNEARRIEFPFGLPPLQYRSNCGDLFNDIMGTNVALNGILPILTIVDCVVKVFKFCTDLPANVASLIAFNPTPLANSVADLVECAEILIKFTPAGALVELCKTVKGAITLVRTYLACVIDLVSTLSDAIDRQNAYAASGDPGLVEASVCLALQNDVLAAEVGVKLNAIAAILATISLLLTILGLAPLGSFSISTDNLTVLLDTLQTIDDDLGVAEGLLPC